MENYNRQLVYVYKYINRKKNKNAGFIKLEKNQNKSLLKINVKVSEHKLKIFAYIIRNGKKDYKQLTEDKICKGKIEETIMLAEDEIDEIYAIKICELKDDCNYYFCQWRTPEESKFQINQKIRKIKPHDIMYLPKNQWSLCNNSFLLHSYRKYRYLMFIEISDGKCKTYKIGVPGKADDKLLAEMFGFTEYITYKEGLSGLWCREIHINN